MKIAIISDIHDNLPNLKRCLSFIKKERIKVLLICGDVGNDEETLKLITDEFSGKIFSVAGNADTGKKELSSFKELAIGGLKIAITHYPDAAKKLAHSTGSGRALNQKYDFVFYGHTHKPWLESVGGCFLANPGNLAGLFYKASFAILDVKTKKLTLKILEKL